MNAMNPASPGAPVDPAPVPTHPEAVPGDPQTLRWVVPADLLGMVGAVGAAPAPLAGLREQGDVLALVAEPDALRITLAPAVSWRETGERVRAALAEALAQVRDGGERFAPDVVATEDTGDGPRPASSEGRDVLRAAVEQVLAGEVGAYLASHGGAARIVEVADGAVTLSLGGTCASCPARGITLHQRLETAIRRLYPALREVAVEERGHGPDGGPGDGPGAAGVGRLARIPLGMPGLRRRGARPGPF